MTVGDALEWIAGACLVASAYLWSGTVLALATGGAFLAYEAQCLSGTTVSLPHRGKKTVSALDGSAIWRCEKCGGEHYLGLQAGHVCSAS